MIGLVGAHRTGKTSLARAWAEKNRGTFLETPTTKIFSELGHDPAGEFDFTTRLDIQEIILERFAALYREAPLGRPVITDRTPVDMLGYTLAEAVGNHVPANQVRRLQQYIAACFALTNQHFSMIVQVQPGIPIEDVPGKAAPNVGLIEHLNFLMLGAMSDVRLKVPHFYLQRHVLDMEDRIAAIDRAKNRTYTDSVAELNTMVQAGGTLH